MSNHLPAQMVPNSLLTHGSLVRLRKCAALAKDSFCLSKFDLNQRGLVEREFFQWGWKLNICNFRFFGWSNQKMVKDKVVANKNRHPSY